jgi:hypothetical protein
MAETIARRTAASSKRGIIVEADRSFITQLVKKILNSSGMLGRIQNVNVNLTQSNQLMVCGEDVLSMSIYI